MPCEKRSGKIRRILAVAAILPTIILLTRFSAGAIEPHLPGRGNTWNIQNAPLLFVTAFIQLKTRYAPVLPYPGGILVGMFCRFDTSCGQGTGFILDRRFIRRACSIILRMGLRFWKSIFTQSLCLIWGK